MQIIKKINKELDFNYNISEVTSICMDIDYKVSESNIIGVLNLEGDYVSNSVEDIKEEFNKKIDFDFDLDENVDTDTVKVEIDDFTYDIDQNKLIINVDLSLTYEFILFNEKREFDKFIESREINANDLEERDADINEEDTIADKPSNEIEDEINENNAEEDKEDRTSDDTQDDSSEDKRKIEDSIIDMAANFNDDFITYHIYIVSDVDTLDGIAEKYHISVDLIKEYNNVDNLKCGMKLVIPISNE